MIDALRRQLCGLLCAAAILATAASGARAGNIDPDNQGDQYAWGENVGWINFKPSQGPGVTVTGAGVNGFAWAENVGWINLSPTDGGVTNDGLGHLSGFAWGENVGWINFAPNGASVTIAPDGRFVGFAWGENVGWINFSVPSGVRTSFTPIRSAPAPAVGAWGLLLIILELVGVALYQRRKRPQY